MVLLGHVKNGTIVADDPIVLPEGASVRIEVDIESTAKNQTSKEPRKGGLYAGQIVLAPDFDEWPTDLQESLGMVP